MNWKLAPEEATDEMVVASTRRHPVNYFPLARAAADRREIIGDAIAASPRPPAGLYRQHEDGTVERVEVDVVAALKRAISYVEFGYDEECREEAAEAKHDLDMCRAVLKALEASS